MNVATLGIRVDANGAVRDLERLNTSMDRTVRQGNAVEKMTRQVNSTLALLGMSLGVRELIQYADAWKQIEGRLGLVTKSTAQLIEVQQGLFRVAQQTRTSYIETAGVYTVLARNAEKLHASQQDMLDVTRAINSTFVISGASTQAQSAALVQLGQAFASGTLRGEELNSVMEQSQRLAEAIADGMGVSVGELRALGATGTLEAKRVFDAIRSQVSAIDSEFARMPTTISQAFVVLRNEVLKTIGIMDSSNGASASFAAGILLIAKHMNTLVSLAAVAGVVMIGKWLQPIADGFVKATAAQGAYLKGTYLMRDTETQMRAVRLGSAQALVQKAKAEMDAAQASALELRETQAAIVAERELATTRLAAANAVRNGRAYSTPISNLAPLGGAAVDSEIARRAAANASYSKSLRELGVLGAQNERVTLALANAEKAATAATTSYSTALAASTLGARAAAVANGMLEKSLAFLKANWVILAITAIAYAVNWWTSKKAAAAQASKDLAARVEEERQAVVRLNQAIGESAIAYDRRLSAVQRQQHALSTGGIKGFEQAEQEFRIAEAARARFNETFKDAGEGRFDAALKATQFFPAFGPTKEQHDAAIQFLADARKLTIAEDALKKGVDQTTNAYENQKREIDKHVQMIAEFAQERERQEDAETELRTSAANHIVSMRIQIDEQNRMTAAIKLGQDAVDSLNVTLAGERAAREWAGKATEYQIKKEVEYAQALARGVVEQRKATDAQEEAKRAAKDADREQAQRQKRMLDSMQKGISSFWADLFTNGVKTFGDLFGRVRDMFLRLVADMLAANMVKKIASVATGIMASVTGANAQGQTMGISNALFSREMLAKMNGTSGLQSAMKYGSSALAGLGIGYGLGSMTQDRATGGVLGAGGGAAAGAMIGGPWGAAAGAVAGFVGGILGAGSAAKEAEKQLRRMRESLTLAMTAIRAEVNGATDALQQSIIQANAQFKQLREQTQDAYKVGAFASFSQKGQAQIAERKRLLTELDELEAKRIQQLKNEYDVMQKQRLEDYSVRLIRANGNGSGADDMAFMLTQERELAELRKQNADQATQDALKQVQAAERAAYANEKYRAVLESLSGFTKSLAIDSQLSILSPMQQAEATKREYERILAQARAGDQAAASQLPDAARAFLESSRSIYASGTGYTDSYNKVMGDTTEITGIFEKQRDTQVSMLTELKASVTVAQAGYRELSSKLDTLTKKVEENTTATRRGLEGAKL